MMKRPFCRLAEMYCGFGECMSRTSVTYFLTLLLLTSLITPGVRAHEDIVLSADTLHIALQPGSVENLTLVIENEGDSIVSYDIEAETNSMYWDAIPTESTVEDVYPQLGERNTTIVISLSIEAQPSDSTILNITVTEPGEGISSYLLVVLTVLPMYLPSIDASALGQDGLVTLDPGQSVDLSVQISNHGNVQDTFLLSVDSEPDLAEFWANWTPEDSNNSQDNSTGNNSNGNGSEGNNSGETNQTTSSISSILMFGNSYTQANALDTLIEDMIDAAGGNTSVDAQTGGGMTLPQHHTNVNTSGNQWNTTLSNTAWDYVVLQDQSQIPSFPRNNSDWNDSKDAAISLAERIHSEGSEVVLFMTWGRRAGDVTNPLRNPNFTAMQDNLESGYLDFQTNMTANTNATVWIAPVGLAWKAIHDDIVAANGVPTAPGNMFYDLYTNDGSHPSLSGSYLSACVMYATLTGHSPVGLNDSTNLNSTLKLQLQQYASDTVFNNTSSLDYPWQSSNQSGNGSGNGGMSSSAPKNAAIPSTWEVRWLDDVIENISSSETQTTTLRITVPSNEGPGFTGVRLYAASVFGNLSVYSTMVVNITVNHDLSIDVGEPMFAWLPGIEQNIDLSLTNTGNGDAAYDWTLDTTSGPCQSSLSETQSTIIMGQEIDLSVALFPLPSSSVGDVCTFSINGVEQSDPRFTFDFEFSIVIEQSFNLSLSHAQDIMLVPDESTTVPFLITNQGSESADVLLNFDGNVSAFVVNLPPVASLSRGQGTYVDVVITAQSGIVGNFSLPFSLTSNHSQADSVTSYLNVTVEGAPEFSMSGPQNNRVIVPAGQTRTSNVTIHNVGTEPLDLELNIQSLPMGISAQFENQTITGLMPMSSIEVALTFAADPSIIPSSYVVECLVSNIEDSTQIEILELDLQISKRIAAELSSSTNRITTSPLQSTSALLTVINMGTANETFSLNFDYSNTTNYFQIETNVNVMQLGPGESKDIELSFREIASGGSQAGESLPIQVVASSTGDVIDSLDLILVPQKVGIQMQILPIVDEVKPGEEIRGTIVISNSGNAIDNISVISVDSQCDVVFAESLAPSSSSSPYTWTCRTQSSQGAGLYQVQFRATSSADAFYNIQEGMAYEVLENWSSEGALTVQFNPASSEISHQGDVTSQVVVCNQANTNANGMVELEGVNSAKLSQVWRESGSDSISQNFTLEPSECTEFSLILIATGNQGFTAILNVKATASFGTLTASEKSSTREINVEGITPTPDGLTLPLGFEIDNQQGITFISSGWILSFLLIMFMRMRRKKPIEEDAFLPPSLESLPSLTTPVVEDEIMPPAPATLAENEVRMIDGRKVNCPSCQEILGVPRGAKPPFRFTCPSCEIKIRVVE